MGTRSASPGTRATPSPPSRSARADSITIRIVPAGSTSRSRRYRPGCQPATWPGAAPGARRPMAQAGVSGHGEARRARSSRSGRPTSSNCHSRIVSRAAPGGPLMTMTSRSLGGPDVHDRTAGDIRRLGEADRGHRRDPRRRRADRPVSFARRRARTTRDGMGGGRPAGRRPGARARPVASVAGTGRASERPAPGCCPTVRPRARR